jgi:hypothetical protein
LGTAAILGGVQAQLLTQYVEQRGGRRGDDRLTVHRERDVSSHDAEDRFDAVPHLVPLSRRLFLAGTAGALLAACAKSDSNQLIQFFGPQAAGAGVRMPFGLGSKKEAVLTKGGPSTITFRVADEQGAAIGSTYKVKRYTRGLQRPYWPLVADLPKPGIYTVSTGNGPSVQVQAVDPSSLKYPKAGQKLPAVTTPTAVDGQGVTPICTRTPACPLHDVSLDQALAMAKPTVLLIATPAFCQTSICGPVLDVLLEAKSSVADRATFIHAEVYKQPLVETNTLSPIVQSYGIDFEPSLFLVKADGTVQRRIDVIFDVDEVTEALKQLVA